VCAARRLGDDRAMQDRVAILTPFADRLEGLRLAAGGPSYADLGRLSPVLRRSTISDVLRGRSNPSLDFVVAFVGACRTHAAHTASVPDLVVDVDEWRTAWLELQRQLGALRRSKAPVPERDGRERTLDGSIPVPRQLPPPPRPFIGRESYLAALDELPRTSIDGRSGPTGLVVDGAAGVGKTALVLHWAHGIREHFPDGDLYLDLRGYAQKATPVPVEDALWILLQSLHVPLPESRNRDQLSALWRSVLAERQLLVILDNAHSADHVRPLLPGADGSAVVVTTRRRLSGLLVRDGVESLTLTAMLPAESRLLMQSVIGDAAAHVETINHLAALCDHNPLAIRILAERVAAHPRPLVEIADELTSTHPLSALTTADEDPTAAVRNVLSWSYASLPDSAARMFRLLSSHPGPHVSADAAGALAAATTDDAHRDLRQLADVHLLSQAGRSRFQMHDLVRHLSRELCDAHDTPRDRAEATRREILWYLHSAAAADRLLMPNRRRILQDPEPDWLTPAALSDHDEALAWCDAERENLPGVVRAAYEQRHFQQAWQIPCLLLSYFNLRKPWREWIECFDVAFAAARKSQDRHAEAMCANALGIARRELRHNDAALEQFTTAATLFRALGAPEGESYALNNIGTVHQYQPRLAVPVLRRALDVARSANFTAGEVTALHNLGEAYLRMGQLTAAQTCARRCLAICEATGDGDGVGLALTSLGEIYARQRRWNDAQRCLRRAISVNSGLGNVQGSAVATFRLARVLAASGDALAARDCLRDARRVLEQLGDPLAADVHAFQRGL
jgi:tetratricopeptide (TPR) repeat protein